jgi:gas vesicle protein
MQPGINGEAKASRVIVHSFIIKKGGIMDSDTRVILCGGLALFTGILLGTGLGLLMAPQTGRRTRRQIKNYLNDTSDRFYDLADEGKDRMSEFMDKGKRFVEDRI